MGNHNIKKRIIRVKRTISFFFGFAFLVSCGSDRVVFDQIYTMESSAWEINNNLDFNVEIDDHLANYNFYVNIRNASSYKYSNLYIFIDAVFPDSSVYRDTIECYLADPTGKWLGSGIGDIIDNRILFKKDVKMPSSGDYNFRFTHGMRNQKLKGIYDIGLRIEKAGK